MSLRAARWALVTLAAPLALASGAAAQTDAEWNRKVEALRMVPAVGGSFDLLFDYHLEARTGGLGVDLGTDVDFELNGTPVSTVSLAGSDPGVSSGGANPGTCMPAACGGGCGSVILDSTATPLSCVSDGASCSCRTPTLTAGFPGVALTPGDVIEVLLRPAPGAAPDADPNDDGGDVTYGSWNRRLLSFVKTPGSATGLHDIEVFRTIDLEGTATLPVELGVSVEVYVDGAQEAETTSEDCVIWDIMDSSGNGNVSGTPVTLVCEGDVCSLPTTSLFFQDVPVDPSDPLQIIQRPAPGALPELPGFPPDDALPLPEVPALGATGLGLLAAALAWIGVAARRRPRR